MVLSVVLCLGAGAAQAASFEDSPATQPDSLAPSVGRWPMPVRPLQPIRPESIFACEPTDPETTIRSCRKILNFYCEDFVGEHRGLVDAFLVGLATLDDVLAQMDVYERHGFCEKYFENAAEVVVRDRGRHGADPRGLTPPPASLPAP